jgi:hemerythrin superfamily protein
VVLTIAEEKRTAIAMKLADIKAMQELSIHNEETLIAGCDDEEILKSLSSMLEDDRKNLIILDNIIIHYGIQSEAGAHVKEMIRNEALIMQEAQFSFNEKVSLHELLKHQLVIAGQAVHKAGQVVGSDVGTAIAPIHVLNFENRSHQERLQGILEILSTRELTGQDPNQGIWARIQDSVAAVTGMVGSTVLKGESSPELKITDIVRLDYQKFRSLFKEIKASQTPERLTEFFLQLYRDLNVHIEAKKQTWYPELLKFSDTVQVTELAIQEQTLTKTFLEEIRHISPINDMDEFKTKVSELEQMVLAHGEYEKNNLFDKLKAHFNDVELVALGRGFQLEKSQLQNTEYATLPDQTGPSQMGQDF